MSEGEERVLRLVFHAPVYGEFEYLEDALIEVDGDGVIVRVVTGDDPCKSDLLEAYHNRGMLVELGEGAFGLPGFVDIPCARAAMAPGRA